MAYIDKLLQSLSPSEVLYPRSKQKEFTEQFGSKYFVNKLEDWVYTIDYANQTLLNLFGTASLKGFGLEEEEVSVIAAAAAIQYLKDTEHHNLAHLTKLTKLTEASYVLLDRFTIRNLELIYSPHSGAKTLLDVLDRTVSPMGARLLKRWIVMPLVDLKAIQERLDTVTFFVKQEAIAEDLRKHIRVMGDLERLISKVSLEKVNPREVVQLKRGLQALVPLKEILENSKTEVLKKIGEKIIPLPALTQRIHKELSEDAGPLVSKGNFINESVSEELDELRLTKNSGKAFIASIQQKEIERTGINSLKVGFNGVFGYFLEVTNSHKHKVPADWIRKQTLTGAERYITEELKVYEQKVLGAEEKIQVLEEQLFVALVRYAKDSTITIQQNANTVARLDALLSFAEVALKNNYCQPNVNDSHTLEIKDGRHPVIEQQLGAEENYVPNDTFLDDASQQILMITGPNMSGKSALLRQTALITLMAQIGSFVPATVASIGYVDKIFTRVGASDNLSAGESTFMVEMNETASIMNNLSARSLILLDEIGRGTSTYDGISIAWSLAEFLHNYPVAHPRTLFATHYHELNELADKYERIKNYHVSTKETGNKVIFLRKLVPGGSEHSFGIHVAKMAGMPRLIVDRANEILLELESKRVQNDPKETVRNLSTKNMQLSFFDVTDPKIKRIVKEIEKLEVNALTPIEALMKLNELKRMLAKD